MKNPLFDIQFEVEIEPRIFLPEGLRNVPMVMQAVNQAPFAVQSIVFFTLKRNSKKMEGFVLLAPNKSQACMFGNSHTLKNNKRFLGVSYKSILDRVIRELKSSHLAVKL